MDVGEDLIALAPQPCQNAQALLSDPGPRYDDTLLRFALSKDALKMKSPAIARICAREEVDVLLALDDARVRRSSPSGLPSPNSTGMRVFAGRYVPLLLAML